MILVILLDFLMLEKLQNLDKSLFIMYFLGIYYTIFGDEKAKRDSAVGLERAKPFIRRELCQRIKFRFAPQIVFKFDQSSEYSQKIYDILDKIKKQDEERNKNQDEQ